VEIGVFDVSHGFERNGAVVRALSEVNLTIEAGQFVSIVGPSGCGKTTLLQMIGGLVLPRVGKLTLDGEEIIAPPASAGYMLARDALLPWRTARANVEFGLEIRGVDAQRRRELSTEWLGRVGLAEFADARFNELSQGMRQRVAIARTLAMNPGVLLMDEPFAALDAQTRMFQQQEFLALWEQSRATVVLVTHDLAEAILLSDRVLIMSHRPGRIVSDVAIDIPRPRAREMEHGDATYGRYYQLLSDQLRHEVLASHAAQEARSA